MTLTYQYSGESLQLQIQSLLDIIEFILNKLSADSGILELKSILDKSIEDIVVIQNNLIDIYDTKDYKYVTESFKEENIRQEDPIKEEHSNEDNCEDSEIDNLHDSIEKEDINVNNSEELQSHPSESQPVTISFVNDSEGAVETEKSNISKKQQRKSKKSINIKEKIQKKRSYLCPETKCNQSFKELGYSHGLYKHMVDHHNFVIDDFQCPYCGKKRDSKNNLSLHISFYHSDMDLDCKICFKKFENKYALKSHTYYNHGDKLQTQVCDICGYSTRFGKFAMDRHNLKEHSILEKTLKCPECPKMFNDNWRMKLHMKSIHVEKNFLCSKCDFRCKTSNELRRHMIKHVEERKFSCSICEKKFKTSKQLRTHTQTHSENKQFNCNYCGKEFTLQKYLRKHLHIHEGNYKGHCSICNKNFVQGYNYKLHMEKHHPNFQVG